MLQNNAILTFKLGWPSVFGRTAGHALISVLKKRGCLAEKCVGGQPTLDVLKNSILPKCNSKIASKSIQVILHGPNSTITSNLLNNKICRHHSHQINSTIHDIIWYTHETTTKSPHKTTKLIRKSRRKKRRKWYCLVFIFIFLLFHILHQM
jgi:hypothetical protein